MQGNENQPRVAVMGAGAVGCYYGGLLARAGAPVTLIGRAVHVDAIRGAGLRFDGLAFQEIIALDASTETDAVADADLVLFCVKSTDTVTAARAIAPLLKPGALILALQNGVDNAERLRSVLPDHETASAVVYVGTEMAGPGHVKHHGRGELVIDPSARSAALAQALVAAGVPTEISDNVRGALWLKLVLNCAYNAVSAIAQMPYGETVAGEGIPQVMDDVIAECLAVASAEGVTIPGDVPLAVRSIVEAMPAQYSSTAQDLARGKRTEIDYLNGLVVRRAHAHGIATPANRALWALVKLLEKKRATA